MIVKVQFKGRRHSYYTLPEESPDTYVLADHVIVEADRGIDLGKIIQFLPNIEAQNLHREVGKIMRHASPDELKKYEESNIIEREAFGICKKFIGNHQLVMKLVDVECQFDLKKITFYFTAPRRVDFRTLVRDLAGVFRIRIDMRQIGVRDQARRIGGYGPCGYQQCCTSFLTEFSPVNLRVAKNQNLTINPGKISGSCGRLMCCLLYEYEFYEEIANNFPSVGATVKLKGGLKGKVDKSEPFSDNIEIVTDKGNTIYYNLKKYQENLISIKEIEKPERN